MKLNTLIAVLAIAQTIHITAQIPNQGFENWTSKGTYDTPDGWSTLNDKSSSSEIYTAMKGTPGNPGNAFIKLVSKKVGTKVFNGIAVCGTLDTATMQPKSGFPYTGRPTGLTGKWQHMIYGSSQGSIKIILSRWDNSTHQRLTVGSGSVTLSGMAMSWADFNISINYTDNSSPDSCMIILQSSGNSPSANDYLWVDNLAFSGLTGINNQLKNSGFSMYPNPAKEKLNIKTEGLDEQSIRIQITGLNGELILDENRVLELDQKIIHIDISGLNPNLYIIRITGTKIDEFQLVNIE